MTDEIELQEVVLVEDEVQDSEPKENPAFGLVSESNWKQMTQGVQLPAIMGGASGAFAVGTIPQMVHWDSGVKDIAASLAVTFGGGLILGKVHRVAAYGWVLGGGIVTLVKGLRMVFGARPELNILGNSLGGDDLIYGDAGYDSFFGADDEDIFTEEELFGIGEDPIIPTSDADLW